MELIEGNSYKLNRKNNSIVYAKKCFICGKIYLGKKYSKCCSKLCGCKLPNHYNPFKKINEKRINEKNEKIILYDEKPIYCLICGKKISYRKAIIQKCKTCCHSCSNKLKWLNNDFCEKTSESIHKASVKRFDLDGINMKDKRLYRKFVCRLSKRNYNKFKNIINPNNLPIGSKKYHIDHVFSIHDGFINNINPFIISHPLNLRVLYCFENISKGSLSNISKDELFYLTERDLYK